NGLCCCKLGIGYLCHGSQSVIYPVAGYRRNTNPHYCNHQCVAGAPGLLGNAFELVSQRHCSGLNGLCATYYCCPANLAPLCRPDLGLTCPIGCSCGGLLAECGCGLRCLIIGCPCWQASSDVIVG